MFAHIGTYHSASTGRHVLVGTLTLAAALGFGASIARAELLASGTNVNPQLFTNAVPQAVAGTALQFGNCIAGTPVMITFSAECSHSGTVAQWGTIQILLNGVALSPTIGNDDAFCSGNETAGVHDGWATQSMEVVGRCRAGANFVAVTARSVFAGTTLRLDDKSTVVDR
jgi:hypothetical protein